MRHLLWAVLLIALLASPTHAATFWDDEMESSATRFNTTGFLFGTLMPVTMTLDTSVKFSGTGSIRLNYPANCQATTTANQCGGAASAPITPTADLWQRVYFRMSGTGPNPTTSGLFEVSGTAFTKMMKTQNGSTYPRTWVTMGTEGSKNVKIGHENVPSLGRTYTVPSSITLTDNRWYCIETHQVMNTLDVANGISEIYVDNVRVEVATDVMYRNSSSGVSATALWTEVGIFRQNGIGNIWWDRWATGNTRIGCIGSGGDNTPPATPAGWEIH